MPSPHIAAQWDSDGSRTFGSGPLTSTGHRQISPLRRPGFAEEERVAVEHEERFGRTVASCPMPRHRRDWRCRTLGQTVFSASSWYVAAKRASRRAPSPSTPRPCSAAPHRAGRRTRPPRRAGSRSAAGAWPHVSLFSMRTTNAALGFRRRRSPRPGEDSGWGLSHREPRTRASPLSRPRSSPWRPCRDCSPTSSGGTRRGSGWWWERASLPALFASLARSVGKISLPLALLPRAGIRLRRSPCNAFTSSSPSRSLRA